MIPAQTIESEIAKVIHREGGYSNRKNDRGGETNFGITIAVARENGYMGPMRDMPRDVAKEIYFHKYIEQPGLHELDDEMLFRLVFDCAVNHGTSRAVKWLQAAVDAYTDGVLGPKTLQLVRLADRSQTYRRVLCQRLKFYAVIVETDPTQAEHIEGWIVRQFEFINQMVLP